MALESDVPRFVTSPAQDGLWFLSQLDSEFPAATTHLAYRVTGPLDLEALRDAWQVLADRHDALRTTLPTEDGVPVQHIGTEPVTELHVVDATDTAGPDRLVREAMSTGTRLDRGPLARFTAVRLDPAEHVLVLALHDAIADDESRSILVAELSECYAAIAAGRRPELPALPASQYPGFARWQRDRAGSPAWWRMLDWWTSALTPPPPPLELPTDRPRPARPSWRGGVVDFEWTDGTGPAIAAWADAVGTTPETVLLAAFQVLLRRLGGADRVSVGAPVSIRRQQDAGLVGAFENLLALGADFADRPTFDEHLHRVAVTARAAHANAEVPFDRVVRALGVDRDPRRLPLVDAMLVHSERLELRLAGARVRALPVDGCAVHTDLTLTVRRAGTAVAGSLAYRASLFDHDSAARLLDQLHTLLTAALDRPGLPVDELPLEDPAVVRSATRAADLTTTDHNGLTAAARVHAFAAAHPDASAVVWDGATVSYGELVAEANAITRALRRDGAVDGAAVAVRLPQGPHQIAALLGVLDAGAHLVCLGTGDAGERGRAVLADLRPVCLLAHGKAAEDELAVWFRDELGGRILDITASVTGPGTGAGAPALAGGDGLAYVAYTSGSTGRPKGIPTTHAAFAQFVGWFAAEFRVGPGSRVAQWAAPGYDASLVETFAALSAGATLYPVPDRIRANPEKIVDWLAAERVTLFQTVPTFAREVLRAIAATNAAPSLAALDHILLAGEALPGELANALRAALPAVRLVNLYGPTEAILATWHEIGGETSGTVPIGQSIPGRQVLVLDDHDRPCPTGVTGHLVIVSPHVTPGYTGAAAGERAAFEPPREAAEYGIAPARSYRTGDFGRRRWDGSLEFRGRRDLQVKFQGNRVELTDIETALAEHESIAECAVVAVPNADGLVTRLVAHVVPARDQAGRALGSPKFWRAVLHARFGRSKYPVSFHTLLGLPRNLGGKVDRRRLPVPAPTTATPAMSTVDEAVAAIWAEVLGTGPAGTEESFFAAGGHSLQVPVLLDRVHERLGVEVPLRDFLTDPTIAGLSARSDSPTTVQAVPETRIG
jgi:amino acid adenylation domain-containing protein